jgi:hypothetical protein
MTPDSKTFEDVLVLPAALMPTAQQRQEMVNHQDSLRSFLLDTTAVSATAETRVATAVSKLLTVLAGERKSDLVEEARSEVFLDVLDDVPCWAVENAVRRWFKHDCGTDERGRRHDYRWAPDPGTLRKIAQEDAVALRARIDKVRRILDAREYVDCQAHFESGSLALAGLNAELKAGNLSAVAKMTFEEAIARGSSEQPRSEAAE